LRRPAALAAIPRAITPRNWFIFLKAVWLVPPGDSGVSTRRTCIDEGRFGAAAIMVGGPGICRKRFGHGRIGEHFLSVFEKLARAARQ